MLQKIFRIKSKTLHTASLQTNKEIFTYRFWTAQKKNSSNLSNKTDSKKADSQSSLPCFVYVKSAATRGFTTKTTLKTLSRPVNLKNSKQCWKKLFPKNTEYCCSASLSKCLILLKIGLTEPEYRTLISPVRQKTVRLQLRNSIIIRTFRYSLSA